MSHPLKSHLPLLLILGSVTAFGPLSIDMYLPAFPKISQDFSASIADVELTLSAFFIGLALGQLIYGPLSDKYGRKKPLYIGLIIYLVSSVFCATAMNIESLILFRFLQSLGSCAGMVISRAIVRDMFPPQDSARVFSALMLIIGAAPILAPAIGGLITQYLSWNWLFYILAILSLFTLVGIHLKLPETKNENPEYEINNVFKTYLIILKDRNFLGHALAGGAMQAGMFAYITGSPYVFIEYYGIPANFYGLLFGTNAFALITFSQINARLVQAHSIHKILKNIFVIVPILASLLIFVGLKAGHFVSVALPIFCLLGIQGMISPNTAAAALAEQGKNAGSASALMGTIQFSLAAISSTIVSSLHASGPMIMTTVMGGFGILAFIFYFSIVVQTKPTSY